MDPDTEEVIRTRFSMEEHEKVLCAGSKQQRVLMVFFLYASLFSLLYPLLFFFVGQGSVSPLPAFPVG
jgi:hypothetical protein